MKIAIVGYSGSGKSTLARKLGKKYDIEPLHLDKVHWLPDWKVRDKRERAEIVKEYLDTHSSWIIDGNYKSVHYERRLKEADKIIIMSFGRFACMRRAFKRNKAYKGRSRPCITEGCEERISREFFLWLLYKGRTRDKRRALKELAEKYKDKTTILKNQRQLNAFEARQGLSDLD